ncbi:hypothetical protein DPMN_076855 [Dreissena polymorpha]|uniref:Uncharacterized protein n=1 Tax=Dreissena polymorpha TaxID=45954 RepID=A0A9D3YN65_DREPO|nr:hypothetical protein DPMN_076855 [Dreissena polymorpha]
MRRTDGRKDGRTTQKQYPYAFWRFIRNDVRDVIVAAMLRNYPKLSSLSCSNLSTLENSRKNGEIPIKHPSTRTEIATQRRINVLFPLPVSPPRAHNMPPHPKKPPKQQDPHFTM